MVAACTFTCAAPYFYSLTIACLHFSRAMVYQENDIHEFLIMNDKKEGLLLDKQYMVMVVVDRCMYIINIQSTTIRQLEYNVKMLVLDSLCYTKNQSIIINVIPEYCLIRWFFHPKNQFGAFLFSILDSFLRPL